jgi:hypothetical protein
MLAWVRIELAEMCHLLKQQLVTTATLHFSDKEA